MGDGFGSFIRTNALDGGDVVLGHTATVVFDCIIWLLQIVVTRQAADGPRGVEATAEGEASFAVGTRKGLCPF